MFKPQSSFLHSYSFFPAKSGCHQPQHVHVFEVPFSPHPQTIFLPSMFRHRHSILSANIAGASVCIFFRAVVPKPSCVCFDSCKMFFESRRFKIRTSTYSKIFFASVWCHFVLKFCKLTRILSNFNRNRFVVRSYCCFVRLRWFAKFRLAMRSTKCSHFALISKSLGWITCENDQNIPLCPCRRKIEMGPHKITEVALMA